MKKSKLITLKLCFFRCGENYVGEFCEDDNPCRPDAHFCENNGTCRIINTADGFKGRCDCRLGNNLELSFFH